MKHPMPIEKIRARLDAVGTLDDEGFLDHFSEAGLLAAVSGEALHPALAGCARKFQESPSDDPEFTPLDRLLTRGLNDILDVLDRGTGEDLALGIAELQLWACALDALHASLASPVSRHVISLLENLERVSEYCGLDDRGAAALESWRDTVSIPEERQIPAIAAIMTADEMQLVIAVERIHQEKRAHPAIKPQPTLALAADDDDGLKPWSREWQFEGATAECFANEELIFSVHLSFEGPAPYVASVALDGRALKRRRNDFWMAELPRKSPPPRQLVLKWVGDDGKASKETLGFEPE